MPQPKEFKKKNWTVKTADAEKTFNGIKKSLQAMFGKIKVGNKDKMKVIYPFAGGMFGNDDLLTQCYIGLEKKNNSEMYIRFVPCKVSVLTTAMGMPSFTPKFELYMTRIQDVIIDHVENKREE